MDGGDWENMRGEEGGSTDVGTEAQKSWVPPREGSSEAREKETEELQTLCPRVGSFSRIMQLKK